MPSFCRTSQIAVVAGFLSANRNSFWYPPLCCTMTVFWILVALPSSMPRNRFCAHLSKYALVVVLGGPFHTFFFHLPAIQTSFESKEWLPIWKISWRLTCTIPGRQHGFRQKNWKKESWKLSFLISHLVKRFHFIDLTCISGLLLNSSTALRLSVPHRWMATSMMGPLLWMWKDSRLLICWDDFRSLL